MTLILKLQFFCLLICFTFFGLVPNPGKIIGVSINDLLLHFAGYAVLFVSARLAFRSKPHVLALLLMLFSYSILIEVAQHFVPRRHFDVVDMMANGAGLLTGYLR